jgi:hypothetical protein
MTFKADLDIDDAVESARFQVLRNFFTDSPTHPYDIHQLLTFHQRIRPPYGSAGVMVAPTRLQTAVGDVPDERPVSSQRSSAIRPSPCQLFSIRIRLPDL